MTSTTKKSAAKTIRKSGNQNDPDCILKLNSLFKHDLFNPVYNNFHPTYFKCSMESACDDTHKMCSMPIDNNIKEMMICLIGVKNWFPLYQSMLINVTPEYYLSEEIFRTILYAITEIENEFLYKRFVECLKVHLEIHSPCDENMKDYYNRIVNNVLKSQDYNTSFLCYNLPKVLEELSSIIKMLVPPGIKVSPKKLGIDNDVPYSSTNFTLLVSQLVNKLNDSSCNQVVKEPATGLSPIQKLERLFVIFDIFMDILDQDLYMFLVRRARKYVKTPLKSSYPMIVTTVWPSPKDNLGSINHHCRCIFNILIHAPNEYKQYIYRYISMLAEISRIKDKNRKNVFPCFGKRCMEFAHQLASHISDAADSNMVEIIQRVSPMWLKMFISCIVLDVKAPTSGRITLDSILQAVKEKLSDKLLQDNKNISKCKKRKRLSRKSREFVKEENPNGISEFHQVIQLFHLIITSYVTIYHTKSRLNNNLFVQELNLELDPTITYDYSQHHLDNLTFAELFYLYEQLHLKFNNSKIRLTYNFLKYIIDLT